MRGLRLLLLGLGAHISAVAADVEILWFYDMVDMHGEKTVDNTDSADTCLPVPPNSKSINVYSLDHTSVPHHCTIFKGEHDNCTTADVALRWVINKPVNDLGAEWYGASSYFCPSY